MNVVTGACRYLSHQYPRTVEGQFSCYGGQRNCVFGCGPDSLVLWICSEPKSVVRKDVSLRGNCGVWTSRCWYSVVPSGAQCLEF